MSDLVELINNTIVDWVNSNMIETAQSESLAKRIAEVLPKNKLYVFYDCLYDYTGGMAAVLAENKEEALDILESGKSYSVDNDKISESKVDLRSYEYGSKHMEIETDEKIGIWILGGS